MVDDEGSPLPCADYGSVLNQLKGVAGGVLADLMQWGTQTKHMPDGAQRYIHVVLITYMCSAGLKLIQGHGCGCPFDWPQCPSHWPWRFFVPFPILPICAVI